MNDSTSVLLAQIPVLRLNELASDGEFEAPVSGDDLAFLRADLTLDAGVTCRADAADDEGLSRCCGSVLAHPGPELDDRREA